MEYAAQVNKTAVVQVIVGKVEWATENLGGVWVAAPTEASVGWLYVDGEFRPPAPFPSWTWDGSEYQPPVAKPDPVEGFTWEWGEEDSEWVKVAIFPANGNNTNSGRATVDPISEQGDN
jgi:hypothetical protein